MEDRFREIAMPRILLARTVSKKVSQVGAALPSHIEPMLATSGALPQALNLYSFEWKWDGVRAVCYCQGSTVRFHGRKGNDISSRYPELSGLAKAIGGRRAVFDGEIIALNDAGQPSFARLQNRMHVLQPQLIPGLIDQVPVWYVIFDLLYLDGRSLLDTPYTARRNLLAKLVTPAASWRVTAAHAGEGVAMLAAARKSGLEGIVAKRLDSAYEPGRRSASWLKIKIVQRQEFVVGGWIPEAGNRPDRVGAMLVGYYDEAGALRYAGRVGSGLSGDDHARIVPILGKAGQQKNPFADAVPRSGVQFVRPTLVIEVEYRRWPTGGLVQQAAYKGIRRDKSSRQVVKEPILGKESDR